MKPTLIHTHPDKHTHTHITHTHIHFTFIYFLSSIGMDLKKYRNKAEIETGKKITLLHQDDGRRERQENYYLLNVSFSDIVP